MAQIIDGKAIAARIKEEVAVEVKQMKQQGLAPKLCVVLVGEDPASQVYVRYKEKDCEQVGIISETHRLQDKTKQQDLVDLIKRLNKDKSVHGILVQLPLPKGLDAISALNEISPEKDVDGLHPMNMGRLLRGENPDMQPCTPSGIIEMILSTGREIKGANAVVVGRSNIVGKPVAIMLLQRHATVTICHSRTKDIGAVCREADILVASVGSPGLIKADMVKKDSVVIDVGVNRLHDRLVGDVDYEATKEQAGFITPVPGGVGPMTRAMLLKNTIIAAKKAKK
ncbi:MAG: bifunctional methylenetetrahydrofolate dehydrogenase/methenyltetrahydrofolate cyclohydrolase FolD [Candidatus Saganbacteria bacterium]|nr:bifunctional methylenetetrahydrofolate dehydrogenase/methenyltetrahydrofolate cyclohydrolase FolD [Candidatus Saganbacteria bacterium]